MRYLLDTNMVIAVIRAADAHVMRTLSVHREDVAMSAIVLHELYFGALGSDKIDRNIEAIRQVGLPLIPFDDRDAFFSGEVRAQLRRAGTPIGPYDVLIAGQARSRDLTVVTNNTRAFAWVDGLRLEDWTI